MIFWTLRGAELCESCESKNMLKLQCSISKVGSDTTENGKPKMSGGDTNQACKYYLCANRANRASSANSASSASSANSAANRANSANNANSANRLSV